jgi:peroxiredoxin
MATDNLKIGSEMPKFTLPNVDGKEYSSDDFKVEKALIVIFSCNHCPYVQAYQDRMISIQRDYREKGVRMIAINSNDSSQYEDDSFEEMKKRAEEKKFNFLYLRDEDQTIAKKFAATHTPEIFVFDNSRKLIYHGKIDDNWKDEDKVRSQYLRDALDEYLAGREISVPETFSIGCTIKWKN